MVSIDSEEQQLNALLFLGHCKRSLRQTSDQFKSLSTVVEAFALEMGTYYSNLSSMQLICLEIQ